MENHRSSPSRAQSNAPFFFAVAPRSPVARFAAGLLTLTFAVLALLMFGVILAGAVVLAVVGVLVLALKRSGARPTPNQQLGRVIDGEHTVESVDEPVSPPFKRHR